MTMTGLKIVKLDQMGLKTSLGRVAQIKTHEHLCALTMTTNTFHHSIFESAHSHLSIDHWPLTTCLSIYVLKILRRMKWSWRQEYCWWSAAISIYYRLSLLGTELNQCPQFPNKSQLSPLLWLNRQNLPNDHCWQWIPISTLSCHLLYSWWDIGTVKMLWNACKDPNAHNLGVESGRTKAATQSPSMTQFAAPGEHCGQEDSESQSQPCLVFCYPCSEIL